MKTYRVVIPYYMEFIVEAEDHYHALEVAHSEGNGKIISYDDEGAIVEEVNE